MWTHAVRQSVTTLASAIEKSTSDYDREKLQERLAKIVGGVAVVIGHNWSVFMGFHGGAGTTPNVGASIAIWPLSALWLLPLLPFGLNVIRYASLMSLMVAAVIPISFAIRAALGYGPWLDVLYGVLTGLIVAWSLRPNIKRLINGTEPRSPKVLRH